MRLLHVVVSQRRIGSMRPAARILAGWIVLGLVAWMPLGGFASERLHPKVLSAFKDIVVEPTKSTVQVYCDGYRAALGTVVRSDGYIVTKASELKGKIECQLSTGGPRYEAQEVTRDSATDLAILKINAQNLSVVQWASGSLPPVGSWLATPGVNSTPVAIGVLSVAARKILPPQAALGIHLDTTDDVARIAAVEEGSAADLAGLKPGDAIRQVNGKEIKSAGQLRQTIFSYQPGDKVTLVIERQGKEEKVQATLGSMSQFRLRHDDRAEFQNSLGGALSDRRSGFPLAIQHDSVLKPTECGGPLVDLDGKAVGLNIARAGRVESYALPASIVRETVDRLLQPQLTSAAAEAPPAEPVKPPGHER
jgi:serine protease Do